MLLSPPLLLVFCPFLASLIPLFIPIARNFEYEYATLSAYLLLILHALSALIARIDKGPLFDRRQAAAMALGLALSLLPAALAFQTQLCRCSEKDYWIWWAIQIVPHLFWSWLSFFTILKLRRESWSRRRALSLWLCILIGLLLHLGSHLWLEPQKRVTHLLAGFIHGAIYDNWIPLDAGILYTRASHALLGLAGLIWLLPRRRPFRFAFLPLLALACYASLQAGQAASQKQGIKALMEEMPEQREGERFTLHYRDFKSKILNARLDEIFEAATFHMRDLGQKLLVYDTHVHIFVYPSREEKKLWFGGDGTDITDVVTPSIHINLETWPHSTLRHELVHALASSFAFHGLGFHPNLAFTEGLAVALAPEEEEISLHEGAASLLNSGRLPHAETLFSPLFWSESGRRAYTVAGSILKFLLDRYGITKVKQLYSGDSWLTVFGSEAEAILGEWKAFLATTYPPEKASIKAESLYRYPGIFDDVCPHSKALLTKNSEDPWITARQPSGWDSDLHYWDWRLTLTAYRDPEVILSAFRAEAARIWGQPEGIQSLLQRVEAARHDPPRTLEDVELFLLKIDLMIAREESEKAAEELRGYLKLLSSFEVGDSLERQLWVRLLLLEQPGAEARPWLRLLAGTDTEVPPWHPSYQAWVIQYLYLRNTNTGTQKSALLDHLAETAVPDVLPTTFSVEWLKTIGLHWMKKKDYAQAEQAFMKAAALAPEAKREALTLFALEARERKRRKTD